MISSVFSSWIINNTKNLFSNMVISCYIQERCSRVLCGSTGSEWLWIPSGGSQAWFRRLSLPIQSNKKITWKSSGSVSTTCVHCVLRAGQTRKQCCGGKCFPVNSHARNTCCGNKFCCTEIRKCFCLRSKTFLLPGHKFCFRNVCFPV